MKYSRTSIYGCFDDFIIDQNVKNNSPKTIEYYKMAFRQFERYYDCNNDITSIDLRLLKNYLLYLKEGNIKDVSVQSYIRAFRAFLTWCYNEEILPVNYSEKFRLPKSKRSIIDVLTDEEIKRLLNCFNLNYIIHLRDYCICSLMLDSGLRKEEVITLKISNMHLTEGYAIVDGKGNKQRNIPIGLSTRKYITKYLRKRAHIDSDYVFITSQGNPISFSTISQLFKKLKKRADIPRLHAHLLRHTFATKYLENGGDIYSLQQILGHTTLEMVKRYVHINDGLKVKRFTQFSPLDNIK